MSVFSKFVYSLFLTVMISLLLTGPAQAIQDLTPPPDLEAVTIDAETVLSEATPDRLALQLKVRQTEYTLNANAIPDESMQLFLSMPVEEQNKFLKSREALLKFFLRLIHSSRLTFGVGALIGDKILLLKRKIRPGTEPAPRSDPIPFSDRSKAVVQHVLKLFDQRLWSQAPLVAVYNEKAFTFIFGGFTIAGGTTQGKGGGQEVGIHLGYNREKKALVFQIFQNSESYLKSDWPVLLAVANVKMGITFSRYQNEDPLIKTGESYYPPVIPGGETKTPSSWYLGASTGFGFPFVGSDLLTFTTTHQHRVLLRVSISPIAGEFFRVRTSLGHPIALINDKIRSFFAGRLCAKVYVN
jgi:hypothetical protein